MDDELPILGEAPAIDLANTWYEASTGVVDYLAEAHGLRRWVAQMGGVARTEDPARLRELRDAVRSLLVARCEGAAPAARAVSVVNRHAAAASARLTLHVGADGACSSTLGFRGIGRLRARLATSCIEVLTSSAAIRRCEGPECPMLFVQDHGRRRFCSDGCSHRDRQRRYRRSRR